MQRRTPPEGEPIRRWGHATADYGSPHGFLDDGRASLDAGPCLRDGCAALPGGGRCLEIVPAAMRKILTPVVIALSFLSCPGPRGWRRATLWPCLKDPARNGVQVLAGEVFRPGFAASS